MLRMGMQWEVAQAGCDCHAGANLNGYEDKGFNALGKLRNAYDQGVVHTLKFRPTRPKE